MNIQDEPGAMADWNDGVESIMQYSEKQLRPPSHR
jgi:hypothetical protein